MQLPLLATAKLLQAGAATMSMPVIAKLAVCLVKLLMMHCIICKFSACLDLFTSCSRFLAHMRRTAHIS